MSQQKPLSPRHLLPKTRIEGLGFLEPLADTRAPRILAFCKLSLNLGDSGELLINNPRTLPWIPGRRGIDHHVNWRGMRHGVVVTNDAGHEPLAGLHEVFDLKFQFSLTLAALDLLHYAGWSRDLQHGGQADAGLAKGPGADFHPRARRA